MAYISGLVIQKDSTVFVKSDGTAGQLMLVPTPSQGASLDGDFWATPVTNFGIVGTGFKYTPCQSGDSIGLAPDIQSFHVVRVIVYNQEQSTDWYVVGNSLQYTNSSGDAEAHTSPPVAMPQTLSAFLPTQILCNQNDAGLYFAMLGAPSLPLGGKYFARGYFNGVALTALSGAGYTTAALLLTALQSSWSGVGTWTKTADNLTFIATQAAGSGTDVLSAAITIL